MKFDVLIESLKGEFLLIEAFLEKDMKRVTELIKSLLEKKLKTELYQIPDVVKFKNEDGTGFGIMYLIGNSMGAVRFNFSETNEIISIDIWKGTSKGEYPNVNIDTKGISIAKILPILVDQIKNPKPVEIEVPEVTVVGKLQEAKIEIDGVKYKSKADAVEAMIKNGFHYNDIIEQTRASYPLIAVVAKKIGMKLKELRILAAKPEEIISTDKDEKEAVKFEKKLEKLDATKDETAANLFKDLKMMVNMVVNGIQNSLIVTGMAGVGKSHNVEKFLKEKDAKFEVYKGGASDAGLYETLFHNRGEDDIIVFDDNDDLIKSPTSINILKAALDSSDKREISFVKKTYFNSKGMSDDEIQEQYKETGRLPNRFIYKGRIIFISNIPGDKFDDALKSRSMPIDFVLTTEQVLDLIELNINDIEKRFDIDKKEETIKFIRSNIDKFNKSGTFNIRTFQKALKFCVSGHPEWKKIVLRRIA